MKLALKIIGGLVLIAALILGGGLWILSGAPMPSIPPARIAAPEGFNASEFAELDDVATDETVGILRLNDFGKPSEHYYLPELGVTYFLLFTEDDMRRVIFVDAVGEIIGDISDEPLLFPMGQYMISPDAYYEASGDGVSGRGLVTDVPPLDPEGLDRLIGEATLYRTFSPYDRPLGHPDREAGRTLHVMLHDGVWKRAVSTDHPYREWKTGPFHSLVSNYYIQRPSEDAPVPDFFGGRYNVELTHFDQQEYFARRNAPMGSTTGVGRAEHWAGTGYYSVLIDGSAALQFRLENDREYLSGSRPVHLVADGHPDLDFIVIKHTDTRGWHDVLLVKAR